LWAGTEMEGAGALGSAVGILHGSPHPIIAYFVIAGIVYGLLPLIFPHARFPLVRSSAF
jgi:hypothetical protein